jgi:hypothetical protein
VLATVSIPIDRYSTSIKRVAQSHNALIVEPSVSLGLPMSAVTVAARRRTPRELVLKTTKHRVSFLWDI